MAEKELKTTEDVFDENMRLAELERNRLKGIKNPTKKEKPFYVSQLPEGVQNKLKDMQKRKLLKEGYSEKDAEYYADEFLNEKIYTAEEFYGNNFWERPEFKEDDKSLDAIKDNFSPPGAKGEKKRKIRASDNPDWVWDNEDVAKRFMATPYLNGNFSKDMSDEDKAALKENYKAYKKMSIDDFLKSKDFQPFYEYVGEDEEVEPNNYTSKSLYGEGDQNPYTDLDKLLDEWDKEDIDTNDNGKIEVDELDDFEKSLGEYMDKNPKGRDDIPVATRR